MTFMISDRFLLSPISRCVVLLQTYYQYMYKHDVFSAFNAAILWWLKAFCSS